MRSTRCSLLELPRPRSGRSHPTSFPCTAASSRRSTTDVVGCAHGQLEARRSRNCTRFDRVIILLATTHILPEVPVRCRVPALPDFVLHGRIAATVRSCGSGKVPSSSTPISLGEPLASSVCCCDTSQLASSSFKCTTCCEEHAEACEPDPCSLYEPRGGLGSIDYVFGSSSLRRAADTGHQPAQQADPS